jgi:cytochrome c oxidase assembly protein subunit 15
MAMIQLGLGIGTIFTGAQIALATAHQSGAVLLLSTLVLALRRARPAAGALAAPVPLG